MFDVPGETIVIPEDSPGLLRVLNAALDVRATRIQRFQDYYDGRQRLAFATSKFRQAFGSLFGAFADNMCALIVDAVEERLDVEGFRVGPNEGDDTDKAGDRAAWLMWQENELDAFSQIAHTEALVKEISYALVGPGDEPGIPEITIESALNSIVIYEAGSYRTRRAGLKRWIDDDGYLNATLYMPDTVEKYIAKTKSQSGPINWSTTGWLPREVPGETWPLGNRLGVVPLVPLINRPRLDGTGQSDLLSVLPIQDAINKLVMDMIVASEFSAYRQRTATGITIEIDETTGEPTEQFQADVARIWASENENAKFGTLEASDLQPFVSGVEMLIQHLASQTRTPYHYFLQHGGQPPSGDSLRAAEAGLNFKAKRKQRYFGESWEEVIRLGFLATGDTARGNSSETETIWRDSEQRTESQVVDALVRMAGLGVPEEALWERWGATPQEIERWTVLKAAAAQVPVTVPAVQTVPEMATGPMQLTVVRADGSQTKITRGATS
jgi:Phage portal protein, SPP1 Gp6-like